MKRALRHLVASTALLLVVSSVAGTASAKQERLVGVGWNWAIGAHGGTMTMSFTSSMGAGAKVGLHMEAANFELRLFSPDHDKFSVDLNWNLVYMILSAAGGMPLYFQYTFFHAHTNPDADAAFAIAPGILTGVGGADGNVLGLFGLGCRIGADITSPDNNFGLGLYARPEAFIAGAGGDPIYGYGILYEMTWVFYGFK